MQVDKTKLESGTNYYQLTLPVLVSDKLEVNYKQVLTSKQFIIKDCDQLTSDLLYFNVITDTFEHGFEHYQLADDNFRFHLYKKDSISNESKLFLNMKLQDFSIIIGNNEDTLCEYTTVYFCLLLACDSPQYNPFDDTVISSELITSCLSEYTHNYQGHKNSSSCLYNPSTNARHFLFHGNSNSSSILPTRFHNVYNFFDIKKYDRNLKTVSDQSEHVEKYGKLLNFVNGKNMFIVFYIQDTAKYDSLMAAILNENKSNADCSLLNNIYETKANGAKYISDVNELIESSFFTKWINNGSIFVSTTNSFGVFVNESSFVDPSLIFTKYSLAVFFALNQRVLNIELQEMIKGYKSNLYYVVDSYYRKLEKYAFYEISSDRQLQSLFVLIQTNFNNFKMHQLILNELELHQGRRLNTLFEKLTKYGLFIALISLVVAISSYFATFLGETDSMSQAYKLLARILADPFVLIVLVVIALWLIMKFISTVIKKIN